MGQASTHPSTKYTPAAPRVQPAINSDDRYSTPQLIERMQPVPRLRTQACPRVQHPPMHHPAITPMPSAKAIKKLRRRQAATRLTVSPTAPARNTRSHTKPAEPAVTRTRATATAIGLSPTIPAPRASAKQEVTDTTAHILIKTQSKKRARRGGQST